MSEAMYIFLGAIVTAFVSFKVTKYASGIQLKIAKENSEKDLKLQSYRLANERITNEISLEREKLEKLHKILSVISFDNSQTMSHIHSSEDELSNFRKKYIENCDILHDALAIADLYCPDMSGPIREIFGHANCFWGYQEGVMQIDKKMNEKGWNFNMSKVLDADSEIKKRVKHLQYRIAERGIELNKALQLKSG